MASCLIVSRLSEDSISQRATDDPVFNVKYLNCCVKKYSRRCDISTYYFRVKLMVHLGRINTLNLTEF